MARRLSPEQLGELDALRRRCHLILDFIASVEPAGVWSEFKAFVEKTAAKRDLRGLRMVVRDLTEAQTGLSPRDRGELSRRLQDELGVDLSQEQTKELKKIQEIVGRGKIRNEREYRMVHDRVEEIYADEQAREEVERLNALLDAY